MDKELNVVEIEDPPIQKLNKKKSCLRRSCVTGGGCLLLVIAAAAGFILFASVPRPKEVRAVPESVRAAVPLYDEENIEHITYTATNNLSPFAQGAAGVSRRILSPLQMLWESYAPEGDTAGAPEGWRKRLAPVFNTLTILFSDPKTYAEDETMIVWTSLSAQSRFISNYYRKELAKSGFMLETVEDTDTSRKLRFEKDAVNGTLVIFDDVTTAGTDRVHLEVVMPAQ